MSIPLPCTDPLPPTPKLRTIPLPQERAIDLACLIERFPETREFLEGTLGCYDPDDPRETELTVLIAGWGHLGCSDIEECVDCFIARLDPESSAEHSLSVIWTASPFDEGGKRGWLALKWLFQHLSTRRVGVAQKTVLSYFRQVSVSAPDLIWQDEISCDKFLEPIYEDDSIDLSHMGAMREFAWAGDFALLMTKFKNIPWVQIKDLTLSCSTISTNDAIGMLGLCHQVENARLGTVRNTVGTGGDLVRKALAEVHLFDLKTLSLTVNASIRPLVSRVAIKSEFAQVDITVGRGAQVDALSRWSTIQRLTLRGVVDETSRRHLRTTFGPRLTCVHDESQS